MSNSGPHSDWDLEQVSAAWLAAVSTDMPPDDWVERWQDERRMDGDYAAMWRFVLSLCKKVATEDDETIGMIGAGPLHDSIDTWPDRTLRAIEADAGVNRTLLDALSTVVAPDIAIRERIKAILARYGEGQQ